MYDRIIDLVPDAIKVAVYYKKAALLEQLNRLQEVPAIYGRIIELAPEDLAARYKKLDAYKTLGWPEEILEDGLITCDQIIMHTPQAIDVYQTKRDLLWQLKRFDQVVDICHHILTLDMVQNHVTLVNSQAALEE